MQSNLLVSIRKGLHSVIMVFTWIGAAALIILVLTTFANVVGRYLLRMPLTGAVEISQLFLVVTVFFGVAYTEVRKQHVTFDEVVVHFPRRLRAATIGIMYFLVGVYALVMSWQETLLAISYMIPQSQGDGCPQNSDCPGHVYHCHWVASVGNGASAERPFTFGGVRTRRY